MLYSVLQRMIPIIRLNKLFTRCEIYVHLELTTIMMSSVLSVYAAIMCRGHVLSDIGQTIEVTKCSILCKPYVMCMPITHMERFFFFFFFFLNGAKILLSCVKSYCLRYI